LNEQLGIDSIANSHFLAKWFYVINIESFLCISKLKFLIMTRIKLQPTVLMGAIIFLADCAEISYSSNIKTIAAKWLYRSNALSDLSIFAEIL